MSATLHIDGLLRSEPELRGMFSKFGNVLAIDIMRADPSQAMSVGSVEMEGLVEATRAVRALHRTYLGGKLLLVFHATTEADRYAH